MNENPFHIPDSLKYLPVQREPQVAPLPDPTSKDWRNDTYDIPDPPSPRLTYRITVTPNANDPEKNGAYRWQIIETSGTDAPRALAHGTADTQEYAIEAARAAVQRDQEPRYTEDIDA